MKRTSYHDELLIKFAGEVKKIFVTTTKLYALPVSLCQRLNLKVWRDFKDSVDISLGLARKLVKEIMMAKNLGNGLIQKLQAENMKEENISRIVADFVIAAGDTNADRVRAYRKRKKDLGAMPSTSTVQSGEPVSENVVTEKLLHQKQLNAERCRRYRQKRKR
ncbi:Cytochrome P450 315a1, mitochondrial [Eumeta japonica]|uniref:Cytochrome P450 315a1, mitochondrial n=1 Tax=Eumeta variegata TaxID=151549 RepID=A0A4C1Y1T2_EUMVA|nr:Cytochrome P450 315a1, mitochondrial [Eumeta japonica]